MPEAAATERSGRALFRHDGMFWRRLAYRGATRGPLWWRRVGPGLVAGVVFAIAAEKRRGAISNLRAILGPRGWLGDRLGALRLFAEFAYCATDVWQIEATGRGGELERAIEILMPEGLDLDGLLPDGRGLVVLTSHFGTWEVGARALQRFGRPVNLVMAREPNPTVQAPRASRTGIEGCQAATAVTPVCVAPNGP